MFKQIHLRCGMRQLPVLERIIVLISLNVSAWDLHEGQSGARLLFHWDLIWVNFVPVKHSPSTVITRVSTNVTLQTK